MQTWKLNGDTLSCKGQPYAVIGGPCVSQDILALFRCVSVRYSFSTSDPAMLGMVGRCFVDQAPIICPNIQGLDKKEYHRLYEAQSCQLDQMLLLPLCLGTGPDAAMWGVLEMTGFMASFEAVASNFPRLLADHGLSTCRLDPIESVISSHLMSHIPRSSTEFGWDWGDEEDRSLNPSSANGSPSLAPGGLISEFAGKQLQAAALSLGSHVLAGSSTLVNAGSFKSLAVTDKLTEDAMKASLTTPASLAISLCNTLLLGEEVDMNTVLKVRSSLIAGAGASIYEPVNSMDESGLMGADSDVGNALRQMLTQSMGAQLCIDHLGRLGSQSSQTSDLGLARVSESSELNEFCRSLDNNSEGGGSFGLLQRAATVGRLLSVAVDVPDKGGKKLSRISSESRVNDVFSCSADRSIASYSTRNQSMDGEPVSGQASLDPSQRGHHSIEAARSITSSPKDFSFQPQNAFGPIKRDISLILMLKSPSEELTAILSRVDDWIFDSFELDRVTCGKPLSCLSFYLIKRAGLIEKLRLNEVKLSRFLQRIEDGYSNSSYHNKIHAADVL